MAGSHKDKEYRRQAGVAQTMADRAKSAFDRESWLRIAQGWMSLIQQPNRTASDRFADQAQEKGTGQEVSEKSQ